MTPLKTSISAMTVAFLMGGAAHAQVGLAGGASGSVGAGLDAGPSASASVGATSNAQSSADTGITSDAVEGARTVLNKAGALGGVAIDKATGLATTASSAVGKVGANVMFNAETALEAGTTNVTSADGVSIGNISGVRMVDGGQMVTVNLNEEAGFTADKISVNAEHFVKGDGKIGLAMTAAQLDASIKAAGSSG